MINGVTFSIASPFDFASIRSFNSGYVGGLALVALARPTCRGTKGDLSGWYGAADTNTLADVRWTVSPGLALRMVINRRVV